MTEEIVAVDRTRLEAARTYWTDVLAAVKDLPCETPDQKQWWADQLTAAQGVLKSLDAEREELVRPLIDDKARIDGLYRAARQPAEQAKDLIKTKLAGFEERLALAQRAAQEAARLAAQAGDTEACTAALAAIPEAVQATGASTQWEWVPSVLDAALVPDTFKVVDESALKRYAKAYAKQDVIPAVPGVVFERKAKISARGGK